MDAWIQWSRTGFVAAAAGAATTASDQRFVGVSARGAWLASRSRNRCKGRTHTDRQTAKGEGRFSRRLETAVACPGACRWMGALVCSNKICCRQFANCWVQLPVPWGPCWDVRLGGEVRKLRMAARNPAPMRRLSRREGYRAGTGGGWRGCQLLGPLRALPADCFSLGWIFGSARCGWERVANRGGGLSSVRESEGHKLLAWAALPGDLGWDVASP